MLYSHFSGNDKAAFLVLFVLALDAVWVLILLARALGGRAPGALRHLRLAILPVLYGMVVLTLARLGLVDQALFLGFR
ncbi:hypothetical protein G4G28_17610 [Massilia sp. Dwa41.01b]|uniref:hypothetical protein n=1 Tax=unclassified Massilia TaxID=2609279 RepID=UPI0016018457|nr:MULTISPECIES: hypothetical protein [unclassified Massilia]QNA89852.1 hypothetical protein G4G28_17610 [Massilia sp. Dwa41.01b]QNB00743.1 hypothetical protein G4G31_21170 [Massilia sp. Se16.2.3]